MVKSKINKVCSKVPPLWSLENYVAVNPYVGFTGHTFEETAVLLQKLAGIQMTMSKSFYIQEINRGFIEQKDIEDALFQYNQHIMPDDFIHLIKTNLWKKDNDTQTVQLVMDIIGKHNNTDWSSFMTDRITSWAADYFDKGQVMWHTSNRSVSPYNSWREDALLDKSFKMAGLKDFRQILMKLPADHEEAIVECSNRLDLTKENQEIYWHCLLLKMGGWSSYIAGLDWDGRLYEGNKAKLPEFLAILLCLETCLLESFHQHYKEWQLALKDLSKMDMQIDSESALQDQVILQQAYDLASQRSLVNKFEKRQHKKEELNMRPKVQAIFCIDVRSEVFRRNLELTSPDIETLGFAGFFAFPVKYVPIGYEEGINQCPVLIPSGPVVMEAQSNDVNSLKAVRQRNINFQSYKVWKSFKQGTVSCFSFVSTMGMSFLPKLFTDAFGITRPVPLPDKNGLSKKFYQNRQVLVNETSIKNSTYGISLQDQVRMAKAALQAMSLTKGFARVVLITGHGSTSVNNPHATGLDCGACGGHSGESNAKVAAAVLNNHKVRERLYKEGLHIPDDTIFIACLHDTTTDQVILFDDHNVPESHYQDLLNIKHWLTKAGIATRHERALKLDLEKGKSLDKEIFMRSKDWSQVRPEWGLAGCNAFIVAPRSHTKHLDLGGKSFLHSYDWKSDKEYSILELIMTAPMVVTSWINLQYYASTVDNKHHGAGNKTLHNITGGLGVLEGYGGDLRTGLAWQSLHDGKNFQHLPQRLNVVIDAPIGGINLILNKHNNIKQLCDNRWIYLFALNEEGKIAFKYTHDFQWVNLYVNEEKEIPVV